MSRPSAKRGFTLIELLVVIAIIALLLSILVPALNHARQMAYVAKCQSNLHTCWIALNLYAEDNKGFLPMCAIPGDFDWQKPFAWDPWTHVIAQFPKNKWGWQAPVGYCLPEAAGCPVKCQILESNVGPYAINHLLTWGHPGGGPDINYYVNPPNVGYGYFRLAKTLVPSETYLCSDSPYNCIMYLDFRHLNKNNFLWADGHVRLSAQNASPWGGNVPCMDSKGNGCRPMYNSAFRPQFTLDN